MSPPASRWSRCGAVRCAPLAAALALAAAAGGARGTPTGAPCLSVCSFQGDPTGVGSGGTFANPWCNVAAGVGGQALSGVASVAWSTCWSECCSGANCYTGGATSCDVASASTGAAKVFGAAPSPPPLPPAFTCGAADDTPTCTALGALYAATGGTGWSNDTGWRDAAAGTATGACTFYGVSCDSGGDVMTLCARRSAEPCSGPLRLPLPCTCSVVC
jgi:hypothetical protein